MLSADTIIKTRVSDIYRLTNGAVFYVPLHCTHPYHPSGFIAKHHLHAFLRQLLPTLLFQPYFATSIFARCCYLNFHHFTTTTFYTYFTYHFNFLTYFAKSIFYQNFQRRRKTPTLMLPLPAVSSCSTLCSPNAFFSWLLFIFHHFAFRSFPWSRISQGPNDLKLSYRQTGYQISLYNSLRFELW